MKRAALIILSAMLLLTGAACDTTREESTAAEITSAENTREPRYGGGDTKGKTAVQAVNKIYKEIFNDDKKAHDDGIFKDTTLLSFDYCKEIENDVNNSVWIQHKDKNYYAVSTVLTACRVFCNQDCAIGTKGQIVTRHVAYWLAMETEKSTWTVIDCGFPVSINYEDYAEDITFNEFTTLYELQTRDSTS